MRLQVKGKNVEISDSLKSYAQEKLGKLDKHLNSATRLEPERVGEGRHRLGRSLAGDRSTGEDSELELVEVRGCERLDLDERGSVPLPWAREPGDAALDPAEGAWVADVVQTQKALSALAAR